MSLTPADLDLPPPQPWARWPRPALFLDLDGTLAAIEARPDDVVPLPWRSDLLARLQDRLEGRLAVVSGRTLTEVDRILDGAVTAVSAVHGLVRRGSNRAVFASPASPALEPVRAAFYALAMRETGLLVEDKGVSLALHYRRAPDLADTVLATARDLAARHGLKLQLGAMVAEICTPGFDKGAAVRAFMAEAPFADSTPLFVGDDLTDEAGFQAARALGGTGVLVGPPRESAARFRLESVEAVRAWLAQGLDA